jgi:CRISPR-associated endonuclease Csn1
MKKQNSIKQKFVLGLDIGIASVGWGVLDLETGKPLDAGVRLFSEGTAEENVTRRKMRSSRRLVRRRSHRLKRMRELLKRYGFINETFLYGSNPYVIRVNGLTQKLSKNDLATALLHIAKHRGLDNLNVVEDSEEEQEESQRTKDILNKNAEALRGKFVCQVQQERFNANGFVRGIQNRFRTEDYVKETLEILSHQDAPEEFCNEAIEIIQSRRKYYDGPGSEKSPTPYGQYFYDEDGVLQHMGMIEKMRGKCTYFPNENRAPKASYTACLFNFLNDLNNLSINGEKLSFEQKQDIVEKYIQKKGKITPKELAKFLKVDLDAVSGFRLNKKGEALLTEFDGLNKIRRVVEKNGLSPSILSQSEYIDRIADVLSDHKDIERRIEKMKELLPRDIFDDRALQALAGVTFVTGYHALSYKAMKLALEDLWHTNDNQMRIFTRLGLFGNRTAPLVGLSNIPFNDAMILSPVARRAQREAIKVVNAVRKRYGELESVVVEMARDKNSKDERNRIKKEQKQGELLKSHAQEIAGKKLKGKQLLKVRLYEEQNGKCLYTGQPIDLRLLLLDDHAYEVDHIIPITISFDDSYNNKTLCYFDANQKKGNRTPFHYFKSGSVQGRTYEQFRAEVMSLKNLHPKKRRYYLFEQDITKWETQREFINRNLVDTRYASKAILNMLSEYFRANRIPTTVHTIRGAVTSAFRKRAQIHKDRDQDYSHHAVDALIVAGIKKMGLIKHVWDVFVDRNGEVVADRKTGEIITPDNEDKFFDKDLVSFVRHLRDNVRPYYSHKVDRKPNRGISDQTIYSIREYNGTEYVIEKCKDIYNEQEGEKIAKIFRNGRAKEKILMARHDPETFALLEKIVASYPDAKNPFAAYRLQHGPIRKVSKKNNGPEVKSVRYYGGKLGIHMDISHKYQKGSGGRVVKLSLNPYRVDVYKDPDGHYKFLRITHANLRKSGYKYVVDEEFYTDEKMKRGIESTDQFQFSLHKGDIFGFSENGSDCTVVKFNGVNYNANKFEYKPLNCQGEDRKMLTIGKKIKYINKYNVDVLGRRYLASSETCRLEIDML